MSQTSSTSTITTAQLAALIDRDVSLISACRDVLPEPTRLRTGQSGQPQLCYPIEDIVEFVMNRTGFMTEIEARLRLALSPELRRPKGQPRLIDDNDECHVLPSDLRNITPDERDLLRRTIDRDRQTLRTNRAKRISTRSPTDTEE